MRSVPFPPFQLRLTVMELRRWYRWKTGKIGFTRSKLFHHPIQPADQIHGARSRLIRASGQIGLARQVTIWYDLYILRFGWGGGFLRHAYIAPVRRQRRFLA